VKRLYEIDPQGQAVAICDLPGQDTGTFPAGIAAEGFHLWYAESPIGSTRLHRLSVATPVEVAPVPRPFAARHEVARRRD
jgi:hypothetical protein